MLKAKISKKFYYLITLLLSYNVLSACGLNSGPVSQLGEIIFLYSNGDNQQKNDQNGQQIQEYKMKADIGNPFSNDPKFYQFFSSSSNLNHFVSYQGLSNNEDKAKANFFKPLAASALGFQINAINSRAALLRTYYYWLTSSCSNSNCGTIKKNNNLQTYFGDDSQNKQLINNGVSSKNRNASSSNNQQLSINDWLFSFFLSNNLSVGDGFSVYPSALFFGLQKVIFHLDLSLKKVKFSNGTDPSYENSTNGSSSSNDNDCFTINGDKYLKIKIQKIYYIYGFNQANSKKSILQSYWKANPNSFPKLLQSKVTDNLTFAVQMAPINLQAKINSSSSKISVLTNNLVWNNLDNNNNNNNNKLYDNSLVEASKLFNYSSTAVSSGMKNVTFDKDINGYHYFPNNQNLSRYLTSSSQKLFSKDNKNGNSFDWKQLQNLTLTDLLMSFFSDFKFKDNNNNNNNNNNNIEKNNGQNGNSSDQQWLTTKTAECLISQIKKNGNSQQMSGKGNSDGCSASN